MTDMVDLNPSGRADADGPATFGFAIAPSDLQFLEEQTRGIWVGGSGNITLMLTSGRIVVLIGAVAGSLIPVKVKKVYSTGTTATNLVAFS